MSTLTMNSMRGGIPLKLSLDSAKDKSRATVMQGFDSKYMSEYISAAVDVE